MGRQRHLLVITGEPAPLASLAALRLTHQGDSITPVTATEFLWAPPAAERLVFSGPEAVTVRFEPGREPGTTAVLLEWRGKRNTKTWLALAAGAAMSALAFLTLPAGWPLLKSLAALWPLAMAAAAPLVFDSGWRQRLETACSALPSEAMREVDEAPRWLSLNGSDRARVLAEVRRVAGRKRPGQLQMLFGQDRRSSVELLDWPLWRIATGVDPVTGEERIARGWYARGRKSRGLMAVGQFARGWVAVGQLAIGVVAIGQAAVGLLAALGQLALGSLFAIGQLAIALVAAGQMAWGVYLTSMLPLSKDVGWVTLAVLTATLPALVALTATALRGLMSRSEQTEIERQFAGHLGDRATADEASLSLAERLTGEDPAKGLSISEGAPDADN